jgi:hypothetical protein
MSFIDVLIPLVAGLLLVVCPSIFLKRSGPPELVARAVTTLRKCGFLLLAVAAGYALLALQRR